jgi:hypothetical protein
MYDLYAMPETPLNRMTEKQLRPTRESLQKINEMIF